jgi:2-dehydropantoate 2-reductase
MKILIFGAGGVGSVVGGFLARTGHDVSLLGRPWHLDAIKKQGLKITGIWGDYHLKAFNLYTDVSQVKSPDFDLILLTVKSYDTAEAVKRLKPLMQDKTMLLSLQNGLGNIETILEGGVRPENYLVGRIIFGVELVPGVAKVTVTADDTRIGALPGVETKMSAFQMERTFNAAKVPAQAVPDILSYIWAKVIYNCALNPICSLNEMPYGKILGSAETRRQMESVIRECYAVGQKKGVALKPASADEFIALMEEKLIPSTAAHYPSMLQDLRRDKRTDIEALSGAIVRYGQETGVPTPENTRLLELILRKSQHKK